MNRTGKNIEFHGGTEEDQAHERILSRMAKKSRGVDVVDGLRVHGGVGQKSDLLRRCWLSLV